MQWRSVAAIVAFAAIATTATAQQEAPREEGRRATVLNVNAAGVSRSTPDMGWITAGVTTNGVTAREALALNAERMTMVTRALRRLGVAERDIQTASVRVNPRFADRRGSDAPARIIGYEVSNSVNAKILDIDELGEVIDATVEAGATEIGNIRFGREDWQAQANVAREDAIRSARDRADLYARLLGLRVHRVISVTEAGARAPSFASLGDEIVVTGSGGGGYTTPIAPGEMTTGMNVSVSFELR
jgi:uncharacterized protein YggE